MGPPQDFKSLQEGIQKSLVSTVKTVNRLAAEDLSFQRTINPDVAENLDDKTTRILELSTRLLQSAAKACGVKPPSLDDAEDIDMRWPDVVDVVDSILEKADTALDEYTGLVKRKEPPSADAVSFLMASPSLAKLCLTTAQQAPNSKRTKSTAKVIRNANVTKPQVQFERKPDNFPTGPWKPMLTKKPHATVPLDQSFVTFSGENGSPQYARLSPFPVKGMRTFANRDPNVDTNILTRRKSRTWHTQIDCSKPPSPFPLSRSIKHPPPG